MTDKSPEKISAMFDEIAPTYDKLNHAFTFNLDNKWRKNIVKEIQKRKIDCSRILDLATGTGDLALELTALNPEEIIAADFSSRMLEYQKKHKSHPSVRLIQADASELLFDNESFDIVTIGFGVRNFFDLSKCLDEISRVLKPGGILIVLEMFRGSGMLNSAFNFYFGKIMPALGNWISGSPNAYSYLFRSVESFYTPDEFAEICEKSGFNAQHRVNNFLRVVHTLYFSKSGC